ncbi:MAG: hypothetical protein KF690_10805 [Bacteroidetes bacterium]|nr:hypothetical protein [Bacteroidota bacterium]
MMRVFWIGCLLLLVTGRLHAQTRAGQPDADFPCKGASESVYAAHMQADGSLIIAGYLEAYREQRVGHIARVLPDGTLDTRYATTGGADESVFCLLPVGSQLLAGGAFTEFGDEPHYYLALLDAGGKPRTGWNGQAEPNGAVWALALQPDGKILVGGGFTKLGEIPCPSLARLHADGTLDTAFRPALTSIDRSWVYVVRVQPDGKILVGGNFSLDKDRSALVRLHADGSLDESFQLPAGLTRQLTVYDLLVLPDGKILVGGGTNDNSPAARGGFFRLYPDGIPDESFSGGLTPGGFVKSIVPLPDGQLLVAGRFDQYAGMTQAGVARIDADGHPDEHFRPQGIGGGGYDWVQRAYVQSDGKYLIMGSFGTYNGEPWSHIVRLLP